MTTIYWEGYGPLVQYGEGFLHIADLNPEMKTQWQMSRWELVKFGAACIWAALR